MSKARFPEGQAAVPGMMGMKHVHEGDKINEKAFKVLIRAAVALNASKS
jgi:hypothetical protein